MLYCASSTNSILFFLHVRHAKPTYSRNSFCWKALRKACCPCLLLQGQGSYKIPFKYKLPKKGGLKDAVRQLAKDRGLTGCQQSFMRATRQGGGTLPCRPTNCGRLGCLRCLSAMACSTSCTAHPSCFRQPSSLTPLHLALMRDTLISPSCESGHLPCYRT